MVLANGFVIAVRELRSGSGRDLCERKFRAYPEPFS